MVDGCVMVFSKKKMLERLGSDVKVPNSIMEMMDDLDGQEVGSNSWARQVYGDPVYTCTGKSGNVVDVNEADCVYPSEYEKC